MFGFVTSFIAFTICLCINDALRLAVEQFNRTYSNGHKNGQYLLTGYKPTEQSNIGGYPLYFFVTGTGESEAAWLAPGKTYTSHMASQGFIAVSIWYNNGVFPLTCSALLTKAASMFDPENTQSALFVLCSEQGLDIDCNKGVVLNGISQGGHLVSVSAVSAGDLIKAVVIMSAGNNSGLPGGWQCLNYENLNLSQTRIRSVVGVQDTIICNGGDVEYCRNQLTSVTGYECPNQMECMQDDGSGWYMVQNYETESDMAGHCYPFRDNDCFDSNFDAKYFPGCDNGVECDWTFMSTFGWLVSSVYEGKTIKKHK
eukprot:308255_1